MSQCEAFHEPSGGTSLLRCEKDADHGGAHEGAFGVMVIRNVTQTRSRRWDDDHPQHRTREQAAQWVAGEVAR